MLRVLTEAIDTFGKNAAPEFLEQAGDMALAVESEPAQTLAEKAYRLASAQLKETISPGPEHAAHRPGSEKLWLFRVWVRMTVPGRYPEPPATEHATAIAVGSGLNELHLNPEEPKLPNHQPLSCKGT